MRYTLLALTSFSLLYADAMPKVENIQNDVVESTSVTQENDEQLKLMYQVFTYASDLQSAYKVAKKAVTKYPKSLYWNRKMGEVAQWLSKKSEAIKYYTYVYDITKDKEIEKNILSYSLESYQYSAAAPIIKNKVLANPSDENIKDMLYIYDNIGAPEEAAKILEELYSNENPEIYYLQEALRIYMNMGELEEAGRIVAKILKHKNGENDVVYVYDMDTINVDKVSAKEYETRYNDKKKDISLLQKALRLYLQKGDFKSVDRVIKKLSKYQYTDVVTAKLLANYYFVLNHNLTKSYEALCLANDSTIDKNEEEYYQQVSDLGWYLQNFEDAAIASKKLHQLDKARLVDYERILYYYDKKDPTLIQHAALRAYQKYHKTYIFFTYVNILLAEQKFELLSEIYMSAQNDENIAELEQNTLYWLIKGQMFGYYKKHKNAMECYNRALELEPDSASIVSTLVWLLIDHKDYANLKSYLFELEEKGNISSELWLPLAVGHFQLKQTDKSLYYVKKMIDSGRSDVDLKFLYANIMQIQNDNTFMKVMREIFDTLSSQKKRNASLMKKSNFLEKYLRAGVYFIPVDAYETLLATSKQYLSKKSFTEISIAWSLRHNAYEKARYLTRQLSNVEPWLKLSEALHFDDRTKQVDILYSYFKHLPIRDMVTTAVSTGNISLAQTLAFQGLEENRYDSLLYQQHLNLVEENADIVDAKSGYIVRSGLEQSYFNLNNRYYFSRAWTLLADAEIATNKGTDETNMKNIPSNDKSFHVGFQKKFSKGYVEAKVGVRSSMESYYDFSTLIHYNYSSRISLAGTYKNSAKTQESLQLLFGGKKDLISGRIAYKYLPSSNLSLYVEQDHFYAQDDVYLGKGYSARMEWYKQIRLGYPDIALGLSYAFGKYDESEGGKGVIDTLQVPHAQILPEDFSHLCSNVSYGMANKEKYTRVWRPYGKFSPCYSGLEDQLNLSLRAGVGGSIYDKDHLSVGISYDQALDGTQGNLFEFYLRYRMFY